jgi:hypothetical protein
VRGFDTETQGGAAVLLGVGWGAAEGETYDFPPNLSRAAQWLAAFAPNGTEEFVAWNLDYDARALLALGVGRPALRRLYYLTGCESQGWKISYIPGKVFRLSKGGRRVAIYDAMQYYGGGLDRTAKRVLGADAGKDPIPRAWYTKMGDLLRGGGAKAERIRRYCIRDAALACQLWERMAGSYRACGIEPSQPLSPATLAGRHFRKRIRWRCTKAEQDVFYQTYYGARIELWRQGRVGAWRGHDIHSAYPAALATLPDPTGGQFRRRGPLKRRSPDALYGAYDVVVDVPPDAPVCPFPVRTPRGLVYPWGVWRCWIDGETLDAYPQYVQTILGGYEITGAYRPLLPEMADLFARRKVDPDASLAIKLLMNSSYGKIAQKLDVWRPADRIGPGIVMIDDEPYERRTQLGRLTHFAVAAATTARCRIAVQRAAALAPHRVIAIATDAVYYSGTSPVRGLDSGDALGEWDHGSGGSDSVWVQPGVYTLKVGGEWREKSRGFRSKRKLIDALRTSRGHATLPISAVETLGEWVVRGLPPEAFNIIRNVSRRLDPNSDFKRSWDGEPWRRCRDLLDGQQRSTPLCVDTLGR